MTRYYASARGTAGTNLQPMLSIYGVTGVRARVREVGVFNTTAVAVSIQLVRLTALGTAGAGITEGAEDDTAQTALATVFSGHTGNATVAAAVVRNATLGAAIGSGVIWTFGPPGLVIPNTTTDGVGIVPVGTGQICDIYFAWDE
jgi:hypothetical protein